MASSSGSGTSTAVTIAVSVVCSVIAVAVAASILVLYFLRHRKHRNADNVDMEQARPLAASIQASTSDPSPSSNPASASTNDPASFRVIPESSHPRDIAFARARERLYRRDARRQASVRTVPAYSEHPTDEELVLVQSRKAHDEDNVALLSAHRALSPVPRDSFDTTVDDSHPVLGHGDLSDLTQLTTPPPYSQHAPSSIDTEENGQPDHNDNGENDNNDNNNDNDSENDNDNDTTIFPSPHSTPRRPRAGTDSALLRPQISNISSLDNASSDSLVHHHPSSSVSTHNIFSSSSRLGIPFQRTSSTPLVTSSSSSQLSQKNKRASRIRSIFHHSRSNFTSLSSSSLHRLNPSTSDNNLNSQLHSSSSISVNDISAPLTGTSVQSSFIYPKKGLSEAQVSFITSKDYLNSIMPRDDDPPPFPSDQQEGSSTNTQQTPHTPTENDVAEAARRVLSHPSPNLSPPTTPSSPNQSFPQSPPQPPPRTSSNPASLRNSIIST